MGIVERLRLDPGNICGGPPSNPLQLEAADLIEQQAARIAELEAAERERTNLALELTEEVEKLEQQRDELQRDAERYRWLRDQHQGVATNVDAEWFEYTEPTEYAWTVFKPGVDLCLEPVSCIPGELDTAIDAAIAKVKP